MEQSKLESIDGPNGLKQPSESFYRHPRKRKRYSQVKQDCMTGFKDEALSMTNSSDSENESSHPESERENEGNEKMWVWFSLVLITFRTWSLTTTQMQRDEISIYDMYVYIIRKLVAHLLNWTKRGFPMIRDSMKGEVLGKRRTEIPASESLWVKTMVRNELQYLITNGAEIYECTDEVPPFDGSATGESMIPEHSVFQASLDCTGLLLRNEVGSTCDSEPLESRREKFLEQIFNESGSFTSCSGTASSASQGCSNVDSSTTTPPSSLPSTTDDFGSASSTRWNRSSEEEEEWDQHKRPRKDKRLEQDDRSDKKGLRHRRLACHFHLLDQQKYCKNNVTGKKYETCSGPGWTTMHYLKWVK